MPVIRDLVEERTDLSTPRSLMLSLRLFGIGIEATRKQARHILAYAAGWEDTGQFMSSRIDRLVETHTNRRRLFVKLGMTAHAQYETVMFQRNPELIEARERLEATLSV